MLMRFFRVCVISTVIFFISCSSPSTNECSSSNKDPLYPVSFLSLEDSLLSISSPKQLTSFFARHSIIRDIVLNRSAYPNDSVFVNELFKRFTHPSIKKLHKEVKTVFGDGDDIRISFAKAFARLKKYYPDYKPPRIKTILTGLETDLYVSDTLIVIGLDYFLGEGASYRPNLYNYLLRRYEKNFVVPASLLLLAISPQINKIDPTDHTVLAEMVSYGKAFYFAEQILPCVHDSVLIGYTTEEIEGVFTHQDVIWKKLVEDEVFFQNAAHIKQRYLRERPKTYEIGNACPGRIGQWVGWQIVREYMKKNPSYSLPMLMRNDDVRQIFEGANYKPI